MTTKETARKARILSQIRKVIAELKHLEDLIWDDYPVLSMRASTFKSSLEELHNKIGWE